MSSDPDLPVVPGRVTGGHVIKNMIYKHTGNQNLEIMSGWTEQGVREYNQEIVPPAKRAGLHRQHPCYVSNMALLQCSMECPDEMRLAGRCATCNEERHELMKCLTKHKGWVQPAEPVAPWYKRMLFLR